MEFLSNKIKIAADSIIYYLLINLHICGKNNSNLTIKQSIFVA